MSIRALVSVALLAVLLLGGCTLAPLSDPPQTELSCSSFCLDNGGSAVFGANFDNYIWEGLIFVNPRGVVKTGWEASTSGKIAQWASEYGSVTFNLAGVEMVWAGMNEAGLVMSTMSLGATHDPTPDERPPLVSPLWMQYQLDTCATVQEVMANDARVRMAGGVDHYLICDRSATCAAVEFLEGGTVFHTGDSLPVRALTNTLYQQSVAAWQAGRLSNNSLVRFGIAADRVSAFQPSDPSAAVDYAFDTLHEARITLEQGSPTQWSIVFDTANGRAHFRTSLNPNVRTIDLSQLDFDCSGSRAMLDVHAPLTGNISDRFEDFSFDVNLRTTRAFLDKYEWSISPLELEVLERGFASFACQQQLVALQEERQVLLPVVVQWAVLAALHRFWYVGLILVVGVAALIDWRARVRRRRRQDV